MLKNESLQKKIRNSGNPKPGARITARGGDQPWKMVTTGMLLGQKRKLGEAGSNLGAGMKRAA
jgi:hypothetical protein